MPAVTLSMSAVDSTSTKPTKTKQDGGDDRSTSVRCVLPGGHVVHGYSQSILPTIDATPCILPISFPKHWFSKVPGHLSPHAKVIEEELVTWMVDMGLASTPKLVERVRTLEQGHISGFIAPSAPYEQSLLLAKFILMEFVLDDDIAERNPCLEDLMRPLRALGGLGTDPTDPYAVGCGAVGDDYEKYGASREWRLRFMKSFMGAAESSQLEQAMWKGDYLPSFEEVLRIRRSCAAMEPIIMGLEQAADAELPMEVWQDRDFKELMAMAETITAINNDIISVPKDLFVKSDLNQAMSNLVLYHQMLNECSLLEAVKAMSALKDRAIERFDLLSEQILVKLGSSSPVLDRKLRAVITSTRESQVGLIRWQLKCRRYHSYCVVENGMAYKIDLESQEGGIHGPASVIDRDF